MRLERRLLPPKTLDHNPTGDTDDKPMRTLEPVPCSRRAQLKYREKQRQQREDDKRTIEELSTRVAALEVERAELSRRNQLLTSVAAIKEAQSPAQPTPANLVVSMCRDNVSPAGHQIGPTNTESVQVITRESQESDVIHSCYDRW